MEGGGAPLPLLTLAHVHPLHTPHDSRHKCLSAPHLCRSDTLFRLQNGAAEFLIPSIPSTHPPLLPSVRSTAGGKAGGLWGGCRGRIPCSIPTNFLISFASMLCPKFTPLTYPPYSPARSVNPSPLTSSLCCFGQNSKGKTGGSSWLAAIQTDSIFIIYKEGTDFSVLFLMCFSLFTFVPP